MNTDKSKRIPHMYAIAACAVAASLGCTSDDTDNPDGEHDKGQTVPEFPGAGGGHDPLPGAEVSCYYGENGADPAAAIEQVVESREEGELVHVRLTLSPYFVDNTYGTTAVGWLGKKGHSFDKLVGSDHAQMQLIDGNGDTAFDFKMDYISATDDGHETGGVWSGDGKVLVGDIDAFVEVQTSLSQNLNARGYAEYIIDSPETDSSFSANAVAPDWDFRVVYEVWIEASAFAGGFGSANIKTVHASPSKSGDNTVEVTPMPCPPDWCTDPDGCDDGHGQPPAGECNNPDGCDDGLPPSECALDDDCPTGESCSEGRCHIG